MSGERRALRAGDLVGELGGLSIARTESGALVVWGAPAGEVVGLVLDVAGRLCVVMTPSDDELHDAGDDPKPGAGATDHERCS